VTAAKLRFALLRPLALFQYPDYLLICLPFWTLLPGPSECGAGEPAASRSGRGAVSCTPKFGPGNKL
jgi:hypothetical protein